jgi:hypothetical protein
MVDNPMLHLEEDLLLNQLNPARAGHDGTCDECFFDRYPLLGPRGEIYPIENRPPHVDPLESVYLMTHAPPVNLIMHLGSLRTPLVDSTQLSILYPTQELRVHHLWPSSTATYTLVAAIFYVNNHYTCMGLTNSVGVYKHHNSHPGGTSTTTVSVEQTNSGFKTDQVVGLFYRQTSHLGPGPTNRSVLSCKWMLNNCYQTALTTSLAYVKLWSDGS